MWQVSLACNWCSKAKHQNPFTNFTILGWYWKHSPNKLLGHESFATHFNPIKSALGARKIWSNGPNFRGQSWWYHAGTWGYAQRRSKKQSKEGPTNRKNRLELSNWSNCRRIHDNSPANPCKPEKNMKKNLTNTYKPQGLLKSQIEPMS